MRAGGEKVRQMLVKVLDGICAHDTGEIEAMLARCIDKRGLDRLWIGQKSRSA
jgi:hypothetical protein